MNIMSRILVTTSLALLLAGPALSLPNMLVIRSVIGGRKTAVFVALVVAITLTFSGMLGWAALAKVDRWCWPWARSSRLPGSRS